MKNFLIISNGQKDPGHSFAQTIQTWLISQGCRALITENEPEDPSQPGRCRYTDPKSLPEGTDCVLVLGGDGTLLRAARDLVDTSLPLLGINMGKLGYLAQVEALRFDNALGRVIRDECAIEERMMLEGTVCRGQDEIRRDIALNDIVIGRYGHLRIVDYNIYVDDAFLCSYRADGIILSTPTGSTGYSLSAGGPIVSPSASMILLTPIAPHTLNSRPVILPDNVKITVELPRTGASLEDAAETVFDGTTQTLMRAGDRVIIRRSGQSTKLVRVLHTSFVEILRRKMN